MLNLFKINLVKLNDTFKKEFWLIISLIAFFLVLSLFHFFVQKPEDAIKLNILSIQTGSLYAVLALGFSLIYGVAKQLKLSLGGYFVLAAYTQFFLLETMEINPAIPVDIDGFFLLLFILLPLVLILISLFIIKKVYSFQEFLIIIIALFIAIASTIAFRGNIVESFYVGLAVVLLSVATWFLEFQKKGSVFGVLIFSLSIPLMIIINIPAVYLSLMILSVFFTSFIAILSDRFLIEKVRHSHVNVMIVTFALALIFQSIVQIVYFPQNGSKFTRFQSIDWSFPGIVPKTEITVINLPFLEGSINIPTIRIIALIISIIIVLALYFFIWFTKTGIALRAVSQDEEAAALVGINIKKTTAIVSGIGMGLIGFAAVLTSSFSARPLWNPFMGWPVLIWAIAVVTLGGMGSLFGSAIAAFMIGYLENFVSTFDPSLSVAIPFLVVIVVMIIKPEGLFGERKELE